MLNNNTRYQAESVVEEFRKRFNRELVVTPLGHSNFKLTVKRKGLPTEGEMEFFLKWFSSRWSGDIELSASCLVLSAVDAGNFHPNGGPSPCSVVKG